MTSVSKADTYLTDPARLAALYRLNVLDTEPEETFDAITRFASTLFNVPIATIHFLDDKRQWPKSTTDSQHSGEAPVENTVCQYTIHGEDVLVIPDLREDPRFREADFVTGAKGLRFYAGAPLESANGHAIGTLCLMDKEPHRSFEEKDARLLRQLSEVAMDALELRRAYDLTQVNLLRAVEEDAMTGLMSNRGVLLHLQRLFSGDVEAPPKIAMIKLQLGRLEQVTNAHGRAARNQVLQDVAERLRERCAPGELLGRLSGTGFLVARVFAPDRTNPGEPSPDAWAEARARDIAACTYEPFAVDGESVYLTASVGIVQSPQDGIDAYALLDAADGAATAAAESGASARPIHWGAPEIGEHRHRLSLERRLREAAISGDFVLAYQPIVDLRNGCCTVGAEALIRWPQEDGSTIGPDLFIPLAEELGLIHPMGLWVLETACEALAQWRSETGEDLWVSVNVSPMQLYDPRLAERMQVITTSTGVDPRNVRLEITESALIERFDEVLRLLDELTEVGFSLSLDDFGTGHSSLSRLIHLPFSTLKVDRVFVSEAPDGPGAAVVSSLGALSKTLQMSAVGEGVETEVHAAFLRDHGYGFGQGYLYAKPLSDEAFMERIHLEQTA